MGLLKFLILGINLCLFYQLQAQLQDYEKRLDNSNPANIIEHNIKENSNHNYNLIALPTRKAIKSNKTIRQLFPLVRKYTKFNQRITKRAKPNDKQNTKIADIEQELINLQMDKDKYNLKAQACKLKQDVFFEGSWIYLRKDGYFQINDHIGRTCTKTRKPLSFYGGWSKKQDKIVLKSFGTYNTESKTIYGYYPYPKRIDRSLHDSVFTRPELIETDYSVIQINTNTSAQKDTFGVVYQLRVKDSIEQAVEEINIVNNEYWNYSLDSIMPDLRKKTLVLEPSTLKAYMFDLFGKEHYVKTLMFLYFMEDSAQIPVYKIHYEGQDFFYVLESVYYYDLPNVISIPIAGNSLAQSYALLEIWGQGLHYWKRLFYFELDFFWYKDLY